MLRLIVVLVASLALFGCANSGNVTKTLYGDLSADSNVNPGEDGRPRPIVVYIYYLREEGEFNKSDFFSLYRDPVGTLGSNLVSFSKYQLSPAQSLSFQEELPSQVKSIGIVASYRDIEHTMWRAYSPLPETSWYSARKRIPDDMNVRIAKGGILAWFGDEAPEYMRQQNANSDFQIEVPKKFKPRNK